MNSESEEERPKHNYNLRSRKKKKNTESKKNHINRITKKKEMNSQKDGQSKKDIMKKNNKKKKNKTKQKPVNITLSKDENSKHKKLKNHEEDNDNDDDNQSLDSHGNIKDLISYSDDEEDEIGADYFAKKLRGALENALAKTLLENGGIELTIGIDGEEDEDLLQMMFEEDEEEDDSDYIPDNLKNRRKKKYKKEKHEDETEEEDEDEEDEEEEDEDEEDEEEEDEDEEDEEEDDNENEEEEDEEENKIIHVPPQRKRNRKRRERNFENIKHGEREQKRKRTKNENENKNKNIDTKPIKINRDFERHERKRNQNKNKLEKKNESKTKNEIIRKNPERKVQQEQKKKKEEDDKKKEERRKTVERFRNQYMIRQMFDIKKEDITDNIERYYDIIKVGMQNTPQKEEMHAFMQYGKKRQNRIINGLKTLQQQTKHKPHRFRLLEMNLPPNVKRHIYEKVSTFNSMEPSSGDYYKLERWITSFFKIPFGKYINLPYTLNDPTDKIQQFLGEAKTKMDLEVFGQDRAKDQILQIMCQWISNPHSGTNIIGLHGPPGVGKTSFIKRAVSQILKRPFSFISLGGATDSSLLDGFNYTYEGSTYGKIAQTLIQTGCMNPVIYFDELDKISRSDKGEEIWHVLTHLTDSTQNDHFHDKYFSGVDFDCSRVLFIFSFNDISLINKILLDRLYVINMAGYNIKEKITIAKDYLLPRILTKFNLSGQVSFKDDKTIGYLIEKYMKRDVKGVRDLQRLMDTIISRINVQRLMGDTTNKDYKLDNLSFPYVITNESIDKLLQNKKREPEPWRAYIN
jgi:ATP-dependent Lon protease